MDAIRIDRLTKRFRDRIAVDDLSLTVEKGELLALLGLNGAGKSTTIRMLSCLCRPDAGDATLLGRSILRDAPTVKSVIGISPQENATAANLSVRENLELMARLHGKSKKDAREKTNALISTFSLSAVEKQKSKTLSGGWRRRLNIAMALAGEPEILFLDEPTLGLDVVARRELWDFIRSLKGKMTVILTTHDLSEAEALSDRIAVLSAGKLRAVGTSEELKSLAECDSFEDAFICLSRENITGEEGSAQ